MKRTLMLCIAMLAMILTACGGEEPAGTQEQDIPRSPASQETSATPAPMPTSPQRLDLDALLTPQPTPAGKPQDPTRAGETPPGADSTGPREPGGATGESRPDAAAKDANFGATPGDTGDKSASPGDSGVNITDLIPQDAETNDQVLLQDIYAQMDLGEFALDPNGPIPYREMVLGRGFEEMKSIGFKLNFADASENPYLHVFPMLEAAQRHWESGGFRGKPSVFLHPNVSPISPRPYVRFSAVDPVTYFIYHPWFESIQSKFDLRDRERFTIDDDHLVGLRGIDRVGRYMTDQGSFGTYWFGRNSTRGVLSKAVEEALEQGQHPNVKPHPLEWYARNSRGVPILKEERNWDLDDYLRTTIGPPSYRIPRGDNNSMKFDTRNIRELAQAYPNGSVYQTPRTTWKILHPQLPIVQVTSHQETILPLAFGGQDAEDLRNTRFSVSFVAAFQHRWTSFQDPNRRIVRFEEHYKRIFVGGHAENAEEGKLLRGTPGGINREKHENFPNYWHSSDYMQHSIIGPVIVHVHESEVIEPGIYSAVPSVTSWEAPGPIAPDEHVTIPRDRVSRMLPLTYHADWPQRELAPARTPHGGRRCPPRKTDLGRGRDGLLRGLRLVAARAAPESYPALPCSETDTQAHGKETLGLEVSKP